MRTSSAGRLRGKWQESAGWDVIGKRASTLEIAAAAGTTATASLSLIPGRKARARGNHERTYAGSMPVRPDVRRGEFW